MDEQKNLSKESLGAFSDAVVEIIMTIMILEITPPHNTALASLLEKMPYFIAFLISAIYISTSWYNQNILIQQAQVITKEVYWATIVWLLGEE